MAGYIFKELRLTGENKKDAFVQFKHGLNVISGPSNTGKTFIFDCLDFMLGSSDKLKAIPEIKGYSNIFLEIEADDQSYTIETEIKNNNTYKLYRSKINKLNTEPEILKRKLDSNTKNNLNSFFLNLNKIDNKKIRKNAKGDTTSLSYRNVVKFALIDEERIITKESPIVSHYTRETEESNTLRFFLTGNDDSSIIKKISSQEIQRRKGKIDLLHEFINNANVDPNLNSDEIEGQLERINVSLINFTLNFNRIKKDYLSVETDYTNKNIEYVEFNKRRSEITELLKRSYILEQQYNSDILRLKSTIESGLFMSENSDASCPTCKQEITTKTLDIEQIIISCESEIQKITSLLKELKVSQTLISEEEKDNEKKLLSTITELEQLRIKLQDGIGIELDKTIETLTNLNNKKSQLIGIQDIISKTNSFSQTIKELESSIPITKGNYPTLTSDVTKKLCKKMSEILKEIGENKTVNYSSESFEFEIGNSFRNTYGKGYRAIYYSVYIIALHEIMEDNTFKIGVPVLDSPLVTYKKPNASGEGIDLNLAMDFYRYLSKTKIRQTIIIENEVPPQDILNKVNHIQFKGFGDGFIPK
ncbi:AAA domain-containing protein [Chryseobacterium arachidis]|uniref:AAA domain-containing protein n=1 Tax=Chryseobacterium arachidis TaxID=1416778 RepID=A0A1M5C6X7_9FLAO|nr:AAA family ATPase [Chryseobacterium arachidis]SHF50162.1 AAA domain-containing protein [Chryseobacterium arachidis]